MCHMSHVIFHLFSFIFLERVWRYLVEGMLLTAANLFFFSFFLYKFRIYPYNTCTKYFFLLIYFKPKNNNNNKEPLVCHDMKGQMLINVSMKINQSGKQTTNILKSLQIIVSITLHCMSELQSCKMSFFYTNQITSVKNIPKSTGFVAIAD